MLTRILAAVLILAILLAPIAGRSGGGRSINWDRPVAVNWDSTEPQETT